MARLRRVAPTRKDPDQENTNSNSKMPHEKKETNNENNKMVNMI